MSSNTHALNKKIVLMLKTIVIMALTSIVYLQQPPLWCGHFYDPFLSETGGGIFSVGS